MEERQETDLSKTMPTPTASTWKAVKMKRDRDGQKAKLRIAKKHRKTSFNVLCMTAMCQGVNPAYAMLGKTMQAAQMSYKHIRK